MLFCAGCSSILTSILVSIPSLQIIGPFGNDTVEILGEYNSVEVPKYTQTVLQGLTPMADNITFAAGCSNTHCTTYDNQTVSKPNQYHICISCILFVIYLC